MRPVYACLCIIIGLAAPILEGSEPTVTAFHPVLPDVTIILDIRGQFPLLARLQMEVEASRILDPSGIRLGWRTLSEAASGAFKDLVVLTFNGSCQLDPAPPLRYEFGAYAFTRTSDGEVQPFGDVDCNRIVNSVKLATVGEDRSKPDQLMGRALGRVVAHELVHMLTRSGEHGREGVEKSSLSGRQLISEYLSLSESDMDRLKQRNVSRVSRGTGTPAESETR